MKKVFSLLLAFLLLFSVAQAAGKKPSDPLARACFQSLRAAGLDCRYESEPVSGLEMLTVNFSVTFSPEKQVMKLYFYQGKNEVSLRLWNVASSSDPSAALAVTERLNREWRFWHFYWEEEDRTLTMKCDALLEESWAGEVCAELVQRGIDILEKARPELAALETLPE